MKIITNKNSGFTLIELMVALSIFIALTIISGNFVINGMQLRRKAYARISATEEAQRVIRKMMREIRNSTQSDRGDYNLDIVIPQEFSFYSNIDDDIQVEKVRYFLDGANLMRGVINPEGEPLEYLEENESISLVAHYINNAGGAIFFYFDGDNNIIENPTENVSSIRLIRTSFSINPNFSLSDQDFVLTSDIQIRNLKDNL